jgi:heptosyltransferase II
MKILLIQTAFLGDVILSLPLVQTLKKKYPYSIIDYLCIPYTKEILNNNPYLNEVIVYDKFQKGKYSGILKISKQLKEKRYDIAFIPHRSSRSAIIALLAGIPNRIAFKKPFFNQLYTKTFKYIYNMHEVDRDLLLTQDLDIQTNERIPELFSSNSDNEKIESLLSDYGINIEKDKIVAIAPGSIWATKRWPEEYYRELCAILSRSGYYLFIIGGESDKILAECIANNVKNVFNVCGISILQTYELLKKCDLLISNDSAPVHLASAANIPVIDIYGPTIPIFGFYPLNASSICLGIEGLKCRPCGRHGAKKCPIKSFDCMTNITIATVIDAVNTIMQKTSII